MGQYMHRKPCVPNMMGRWLIGNSAREVSTPPAGKPTSEVGSVHRRPIAPEHQQQQTVLAADASSTMMPGSSSSGCCPSLIGATSSSALTSGSSNTVWLAGTPCPGLDTPAVEWQQPIANERALP